MNGMRAMMRIIPGALFILMLISVIHAQSLAPEKIVYRGDTKGDVVFRHKTHGAVQDMTCSDCHSSIFKLKTGTSGMTNTTINSGKHCGSCHDGKKAFSVKDGSSCGKCHTAR